MATTSPLKHSAPNYDWWWRPPPKSGAEQATRRPPMKSLALAMLAAAFPAAAQEVTLKFHHIWNPQAMASVQVITPWCNKIAAESNNRLKCQVLPAMSGGGTPPQLVDRVKDGV